MWALWPFPSSPPKHPHHPGCQEATPSSKVSNRRLPYCWKAGPRSEKSRSILQTLSCPSGVCRACSCFLQSHCRDKKTHLPGTSQQSSSSTAKLPPPPISLWRPTCSVHSRLHLFQSWRQLPHPSSQSRYLRHIPHIPWLVHRNQQWKSTPAESQNSWKQTTTISTTSLSFLSLSKNNHACVKLLIL